MKGFSGFFEALQSEKQTVLILRFLDINMRRKKGKDNRKK